MEKTLSANEYLLEILIGEGIISKKTDIMRYKKPDDTIDEFNRKTVNEMIEKILSEKMISVENRFKEHDKEILEIKQNVLKIGTDVEKLKKSMIVMEDTVRSVKEKVNTIETKIDGNHSELKNLLLNMLNKSQ